MYDGCELVWDEERGEYVIRPYATAQQTIFNADYTVVNEEEAGGEVVEEGQVGEESSEEG